MRIKTVMNHNQNDGLLKMIRRTDPMIHDVTPQEAEAEVNNFIDMLKENGIA